MFKRTIKAFIVSLVLLSSTVNVFALEEYVAEIYKEIDSCFTSKNEEKLYAVLSRNNKDKYYYLIENYTQKKIRRLIVNNEYDFAMEATLAVIENNLDNEEAVEMYSVISDAYEIQRKHEAELEYQRQLELARIEKEKEKQRGNVEKEYVSASKTSGGAVYVAGKETKLTSTNWQLKLGMADVAYLFSKSEIADISSFHYGVSGEFNYKYTMENKNVIGADAFIGAQFLALADEEKIVPLLMDGELAIKLAFGSLSKNFFIRAGFNAIITGKSETAPLTAGVMENFYSPFVGIKLDGLSLGSVKLDFAADWLAGHLFDKNVKAAAGVAMNIGIPFAELEKVKLNFNIGVKDKFFLTQGGLENRASVILAIGVENVVR
jgi:hypothetical protein